jgi:hypothetical protein
VDRFSSRQYRSAWRPAPPPWSPGSSLRSKRFIAAHRRPGGLRSDLWKRQGQQALEAKARRPSIRPLEETGPAGPGGEGQEASHPSPKASRSGRPGRGGRGGASIVVPSTGKWWRRICRRRWG